MTFTEFYAAPIWTQEVKYNGLHAEIERLRTALEKIKSADTYGVFEDGNETKPLYGPFGIIAVTALEH